jgi:diacylglycerol kinase (ATP)
MKRFLLSFSFAWKGIRAAWSGQVNMRIHVIAAVLVIVAGAYFKVAVGEWVAIVVVIALVVVSELVNTAIEGVVDLVSPERNPLAGKIKDIAAGAVLVAAAAASIVGLLIFGKYFID